MILRIDYRRNDDNNNNNRYVVRPFGRIFIYFFFFSARWVAVLMSVRLTDGTRAENAAAANAVKTSLLWVSKKKKKTTTHADDEEEPVRYTYPRRFAAAGRFCYSPYSSLSSTSHFIFTFRQRTRMLCVCVCAHAGAFIYSELLLYYINSTSLFGFFFFFFYLVFLHETAALCVTRCHGELHGGPQFWARGQWREAKYGFSICYYNIQGVSVPRRLYVK